MNYYRFKQSVDVKEIGPSYPQVGVILPLNEVDTRASSLSLKRNFLDIKVESRMNFSLKGLCLGEGIPTDVLSSILFTNHTYIVSLRSCEALSGSVFYHQGNIELLPDLVEIIKNDRILEYRILRIMPLPLEEYVDFPNSEFYAGVAGLDKPIGFESYQDLLEKNKLDTRWSMVFGKCVRFSKPLDLDIFTLGKVRRLTFVSQKFVDWFKVNAFTGGQFVLRGDETQLEAR